MAGIWLPSRLAIQKPLTRSISPYSNRAECVCVHTMVGSLPGSWSWSNREGGSYWGLGTSGLGECWQCHDLYYRSAANLHGNPYVLPIENADMGPGFGPWSGHCGDVPPFTRAQVDKLVDVIAWLCLRFDIPPVLIPDTKPGRRGIAYHRQGINPWRVDGGVLWSNSTGKCCPDWRRIAQLTNEIVPRVRAIVLGVSPPEDDDMAYYTIYSGPSMASRLYVDGALITVSGTELGEMVARYKAAGYTEKRVSFTESDDYARYVHGHPTQAIANTHSG